MTFNSKTIGQIAIFIALITSLAVIVYQTVMHQVADIFFSSVATLLIGKYIHELGFDGGVTSALNLTDTTLTNSVVSNSASLTNNSMVPATIASNGAKKA